MRRKVLMRLLLIAVLMGICMIFSVTSVTHPIQISTLSIHADGQPFRNATQDNFDLPVQYVDSVPALINSKNEELQERLVAKLNSNSTIKRLIDKKKMSVSKIILVQKII